VLLKILTKQGIIARSEALSASGLTGEDPGRGAASEATWMNRKTGLLRRKC
jgi:hypothetical protein